MRLKPHSPSKGMFLSNKSFFTYIKSSLYIEITKNLAVSSCINVHGCPLQGLCLFPHTFCPPPRPGPDM
jgi:hypothetical protein